MRRKFFAIAAMCCFAMATQAQGFLPPSPEIDPEPGNTTEWQQHSVKGTPPIAPATLLLLGLAGGVAGVKLYRNSKSND